MCMSGSIYILREREFMALGQFTYKVGRTGDICKRIRGYPKGSNVLFNIKVFDMKETEKNVLDVFKETFVQCRDIGLEYFQGNIYSMIETIVRVVRTNEEPQQQQPHNDNDNENQQITLPKIDPTIAVIQFVDSNRANLSEKTIKSKDVYESFLEWATSMNYLLTLTHNRFTEELASNFAVSHGVHRFNDGVFKALHFPVFLLFPNGDKTNPAFIEKKYSNYGNTRQFVEEFVVEDKAAFFTLKELKNVFKSSKYYNVSKVSGLKNDAIKILMCGFCEQKTVQYKKFKNVFMGYSINKDLVAAT